MPFDVTLLASVPEEVAEKLQRANLHDLTHLLAAVATPESRTVTAERLQVNADLLLAVAQQAELTRVKGIGSVYADLLTFVGVDTLNRLAAADPSRLLQQMAVMAIDHHVWRLPSRRQVEAWVIQAQELDSYFSPSMRQEFDGEFNASGAEGNVRL